MTVMAVSNRKLYLLSLVALLFHKHDIRILFAVKRKCMLPGNPDCDDRSVVCVFRAQHARNSVSYEGSLRLDQLDRLILRNGEVVEVAINVVINSQWRAAACGIGRHAGQRSCGGSQ
jgi:hypothetical protein